MRRVGVASLAALLLLAGCSQEGEVYSLAAVEVRRHLTAMDLPPLVFGEQQLLVDASADKHGNVVWIVQRRSGEELFRYVATVSEEGAQSTRVALDMIAPESGPSGNVAKRLAEKPAIRNMYIVAMEERIDSRLEGRPFEMTRIYPAMTAASMANMGSLRSSFEAAAEASERQARSNIERAYQKEAEGKW